MAGGAIDGSKSLSSSAGEAEDREFQSDDDELPNEVINAEEPGEVDTDQGKLRALLGILRKVVGVKVCHSIVHRLITAGMERLVLIIGPSAHPTPIHNASTTYRISQTCAYPYLLLYSLLLATSSSGIILIDLIVRINGRNWLYSDCMTLKADSG